MHQAYFLPERRKWICINEVWDVKPRRTVPETHLPSAKVFTDASIEEMSGHSENVIEEWILKP